MTTLLHPNQKASQPSPEVKQLQDLIAQISLLQEEIEAKKYEIKQNDSEIQMLTLRIKSNQEIYNNGKSIETVKKDAQAKFRQGCNYGN